ncbi:MAG TPA: hypothetical protein VE011_03460 [Candidatus Dormibacteraeota bacterium]|nr:hypothetical protein [Candidatus Dormibacteraeota bacterium]
MPVVASSPAEGDAPGTETARLHADVFLQVITGGGFAQPNPSRMSEADQRFAASGYEVGVEVDGRLWSDDAQRERKFLGGNTRW